MVPFSHTLALAKSIAHAIYWGAEGLGEGYVKITLIVSCLEWLTCLFLFIMVEFEKVLYSPDLKMVLIFLVTKVFQKGTMFKCGLSNYRIYSNKRPTSN